MNELHSPIKKRAFLPARFVRLTLFGHPAGKEGQISNPFIRDLDLITDFLDHHRSEIQSLTSEGVNKA